MNNIFVCTISSYIDTFVFGLVVGSILGVFGTIGTLYFMYRSEK